MKTQWRCLITPPTVLSCVNLRKAWLQAYVLDVFLFGSDSSAAYRLRKFRIDPRGRNQLSLVRPFLYKYTKHHFTMKDLEGQHKYNREGTAFRAEVI